MESTERKLNLLILILGIFIALAVLIPIILYYLNFSENEISKDPANWSAFGDYIGGVIGTNLSIIAIIISFISIMYSLRISRTIHTSETELVKTQNKPYGYIELVRYFEYTEIILHNHGIGTLVVQKILISDKKNRAYKDFNQLLRIELGDIFSEDNILIKFNSDNSLICEFFKKSFKSIFRRRRDK